MADTIERVDTDTFDLIMLMNENEPDCEPDEKHHQQFMVECAHSASVRLRMKCVGDSRLACEYYGNGVRLFMRDNPDRSCNCGSRIADCWTLHNV